MKDSKRFYFDGHVHMPSERVEKTAKLAISRGLNAIFFVNYGNDENFKFLCRNEDENNRHILNPIRWDIERKSDRLIKLINNEGELYVLNAEEIKTKQGHILSWGIRKAIANGRDIKETFNEIYKQGAVAVFAHLGMSIFHGCKEEIFNEVYSKFKENPIALEKNGQVPLLWEKIFHPNKKIEEIAEKYNLALFGNSDIHGEYLNEHKNIGIRHYSSVSNDKINLDFITESLAEIIKNSPESVQIEGNSNPTWETIAWNIDSIRKNKREKLDDLIDGIKNCLKK